MIAGASMRVARYVSVSKLVDVSGGGQHGPDTHTRHGAPACPHLSTGQPTSLNFDFIVPTTYVYPTAS